MATATKAQPEPKKRPSQGPRKWTETSRRSRWPLPAAVVGAIAVGTVLVAAVALRGGDTSGGSGLPRTSDYHSLLVAAGETRALVLGTHEGLFRSNDGGRSWVKAQLGGRDAMNLSAGETLWAAGHDVLAKSTDGGASWEDVGPLGLPSLDVHGFAVDPSDPNRLYAAIAGRGLYRSRDGGESFSLVSRVVGPGVMALAVLDDGTLLAGDMQRQALARSSNGGRAWQGVVQASVMGLAVNPGRPRLVLASGPGVFRSTDGGRTWKRTLALEAGAGPVAWSPGEPGVAYVVGFDRSLWRSGDYGATWTAVVPGEEG